MHISQSKKKDCSYTPQLNEKMQFVGVGDVKNCKFITWTYKPPTNCTCKDTPTPHYKACSLNDGWHRRYTSAVVPNFE